MELRVPEGTLSSRLATARRKLADRLRRRGVTASIPAILAAMAEHASALPPGALARAAVTTACSPMANAVAETVVKSLLVSQLKSVLIATGLACMVLAGGAFGFGPGDRPRAAAEEARVEPTPSAEAASGVADEPKLSTARAGHWHAARQPGPDCDIR